jgi:hypothetical protein
MPLRPKFYRLLGGILSPMRHTDKEIERAAARLDQLADDLDPDTVHAEETNDLRRVGSRLTPYVTTKPDFVRLSSSHVPAADHGTRLRWP